MRIGVDACCWANRRGFGRFTRELLTALVELNEASDHPHELRFLVDRHSAGQAEFPSSVTIDVVDTSESPTSAASASGSRSIADLLRFRRAVGQLDCDVFFFPAVYTFFPLPFRLPALITLHDAIAEQHPDLIFSRRRSRLAWGLKMRWALHSATRVLTVSEAAKQQILDTFGLPQERIDVAGEGPAPEFRRLEDPDRIADTLRRLTLPENQSLVLYVGGISPHKNLDGLLRAMARIEGGQPQWHLVLVGDLEGDSFLTCHQQLAELIESLGLEDRVTFTGFVSNQDLVSLYNAASLTVLPSFSEGFGLPMIEAMSCGSPVAASRRGSLPEVIGDAGVLFDPTVVEEMAEAIETVLRDETLQARLAEAGTMRARGFTWAKSAGRVMASLERTAVDGGRLSKGGS